MPYIWLGVVIGIGLVYGISVLANLPSQTALGWAFGIIFIGGGILIQMYMSKRDNGSS